MDDLREREYHNAVSDGRDAFRAGKTECPHQNGTLECNGWWQGWNEAQQRDAMDFAQGALTGRAP